ncbi:MAG: MBL fold metallo-hydrolase [Peptoniphilus sp.]|uniref:MBL fold metallo-hydrolase n=1 Tax=Peptoniphilus sp. TaxID=1971214 RepID=UPI002A758A47|nr:MBL fold metallo-hydrolase [Peptoniphilus sp.]MDY2986118.1 MBL fold metallo-hydrolase [Peptoniphilus sp.]
MKIEIFASGSSGNCYKVSNEDTALLIECGIPIKEIRKKLNYNLDVDACLVTHEHGDHSKACKELLRSGTMVYMSKGTKDALCLDSPFLYTFKSYHGGYVLHRINSFTVLPFEVIHDAREPVGFFIRDTINCESLVFITDTQYIPYSFNMDYLMLEINYVSETINNADVHESLRKRIKESHLSLETALDFLKKCDLSKCKKIYILHLSSGNSDEKKIKEEVQKLTGLPVEIC